MVEGAGRAGRPSRPIGAQPAGYRAAEQPESTSTFRPAMWPARPTRAWSIAVAVLLMIRLKRSKLQWARGQLGGRWRRCSGCYGGSVESASVRKRLQRSLYRRYGELRRRESSLSLAAPRAVSKDRAAQALRPCCRGQIFSPEGLQPPPRVAVTVPRRGGSTSPPLRRVAHSWTRLGPTGVDHDEAVTPQPQLLLCPPSASARPPLHVWAGGGNAYRPTGRG